MALAQPLQARHAGFLSGGALRSARAPRAVSLRGAAPPPRAGLFDFLSGPKPEPAAAGATQAFICLDCGYIYKGDISKESFFYKCPVCDVGKNRFKPAETAGGAYKNLAAAKKAAKVAKASSKPTERPRDRLRAEAIERARKFDEAKGRGGGASGGAAGEKKKGGWPF